MLKAASVLGREFTVADLVGVTGQSASHLAPALGQALAAEVLSEHGDRLAFRHDLLREAVYAGIPALLRHARHRDAATALHAAGAPLVRVAGHDAAGSQLGDEEAIGVLTAAAEQLFAIARGAAADMTLRALGLLGEGDTRQAEMTARAVELLGNAAREDEARSLGEALPSRPPAAAGDRCADHAGRAAGMDFLFHARSLAGTRGALRPRRTRRGPL